MSNPRAEPNRTDPPHVLDPGTDDVAVRRVVDEWLTFHDALCLRPTRAIEWLVSASGDPVRALRRSDVRSSLSASDLANRRTLLSRCGAVLVPYPSPAYPAMLRPIPDPPPLLVVRGSVEHLCGPAVAIVGARAATGYGLGIAHDLAAGLARRGIVVVSGLARGIDAAAHKGALEAGGVTIAVQACGPEITYPPEHRGLADRIAASGAVVTELPPGRAPVAAHFPLRNRLISGLSLGVVVVEARLRSGSLITARHALNQGREVLAVPGPITAPTSAGPNGLLRDGARPVLDLADVVEAVGLDASGVSLRSAARTGSPPASSDEERILALLREVPCTPDELLAALGVSPRELASRLLGLELDGRVVKDRDGRLRVVVRGLF